MQDEEIKIKLDFLTLYIFSALLWAAGLGIEYFRISWQKPVDFFFIHIFVVGYIMMVAFTPLMFVWVITFSIGPKGLKGGVWPVLKMKWSDIKRVNRAWPFPIYYLSNRWFFPTRFMFIAGPLFIKNIDEFRAALKKYAPKDHPLRRRFLPETDWVQDLKEEAVHERNNHT